MKRHALYFTAPGKAEIREEPVEELKKGRILVKTLFSAVSAGTEMLLYRGEVPPGMVIDESLPGYRRPFSYPCKYGYASVGEVIDQRSVGLGLLGKKVFAFHPHESAYTVAAKNVMPLAPGIPAEELVMFPFMETALALVMDAGPLIGERTVIFGQGVIGLLAAALLSLFPLDGLYTLDRHCTRREKSLSLGADMSFDPWEKTAVEALKILLWGNGRNGADLVFELSGDPQTLELAIELTGFDGRVVIGSWYGTRRAPAGLGGDFHRRRIRMASSQVSNIAPRLSGRWDRERRTRTAMRMIDQVRPAEAFSRNIPFLRAAETYGRLADEPDKMIQVIFSYER